MMDTTELNPAQLAAVEYIDGPSLVIAGAGSGKTRVLTYKIAYLMQQGMAPYNILALTFTNKAAREMKERIATLVGDDRAAPLWMGTFHSIASRILRREAELIGFGHGFTIYDAADSLSLVKTIIKEMGLDDKAYPAKSVAAAISKAKERLLTPQDYAADRVAYEQDQRSHTPAIGQIYAHYQRRLRSAEAMDFDDLLLYTHRLFADHDDVRQRYAQRFRFVLVDEYQDTNYAQHSIVWQLAHEHRHVCVVGDDAQSIYSFRGANIDNILRFQDLYDGAKLFKLEQNYRSTQAIVAAAARLIAHNDGQIPKEVFSLGDVGEPPHVFCAFSDLEEADVVARRIDTLHRQSYDYGAFAILYRTNFQSRTFEESLRRAGIPYRIYGGLSFYQRKEIKDIIAYCRLSVNPNDEEALRRVINYPARGIGQTTLTRLGQAALDEGKSMWQVLCEGKAGVSGAMQARLDRFAAMIHDFASLAVQVNAAKLMEHIVKGSGIYADLAAGREAEDETRRENVKELFRAVGMFVKHRGDGGEPCMMADYLQEVSLLSDMDEDDADQQASLSSSRVTLMTIHSAKGLEFPVVFVVGMEEELFPSARCMGSPRAIEEERRLCYVAVTRAMRLCYLTYAKSRFKYGQTQLTRPSRFLSELTEADERRTERATPDVRRVTRAVVPPPPPPRHAKPCALTVGSRVVHARFGEGTVAQLSGEGIDLKATVHFDTSGTKVLLLRFAQLTVI